MPLSHIEFRCDDDGIWLFWETPRGMEFRRVSYHEAWRLSGELQAALNTQSIERPPKRVGFIAAFGRLFVWRHIMPHSLKKILGQRINRR